MQKVSLNNSYKTNPVEGFSKSIFIGLFILMVIAAPFANAATYYVDFQNGSDSNNGTSDAAAWKHAPGDPTATGAPASANLQAGDVILFRGGVSYRGNLMLKHSGADGNPITYKGDGWGTGKALIDGSEPLQGTWQKVSSAADVSDNPNWGNIYSIPAPSGITAFTPIYEDDDMLDYSQDPNQPDPFYFDRYETFRDIPMGNSQVSATRTSLRDSRFLTQGSSDFWNGAYVIVWTTGNLTPIKPITGFNPSSDTITFSDLGNDPYTDRDGRYSIINHPSLIDQPGEYCYDSAKNRILLWPRHSDINNHQFSYGVRKIGINIDGRDNITIEGFKIHKFWGNLDETHQGIGIYVLSWSKTTRNTLIRNNEIVELRSVPKSGAIHSYNVDNMIVDGNTLIDNQGNMAILGTGTNINVKNNYIRRNSRLGVWFMNADRSQIFNNTVVDVRGSHANGISVYQDSSDVLVMNNKVIGADIAFTFRDGTNLYVFNNVFDGNNGTMNAAEWANMNGTVAFFNNVMPYNSKNNSLNIGDGAADQYVVCNNVLDGASSLGSPRTHNGYIGLRYDQAASYGWALKEGEFVQEDLSKLFVGPSNMDFRVRTDSQAYNAGRDVSSLLPMSIFPELRTLLTQKTPVWNVGLMDLGVTNPSDGGAPSPTTPPAPQPTATPAAPAPPTPTTPPQAQPTNTPVQIGQTPVVVPSSTPAPIQDNGPNLLNKGLQGFTMEVKGAAQGNLSMTSLPDAPTALKIGVTAIDSNTPHYPRLNNAGFPLVAGRAYNFRIRLRSENVQRNLALSLGASRWQYVVAGTDWKEYNLQFVSLISSNTGGYFQMANFGENLGTVYISDAVLTDSTVPGDTTPPTSTPVVVPTTPPAPTPTTPSVPTPTQTSVPTEVPVPTPTNTSVPTEPPVSTPTNTAVPTEPPVPTPTQTSVPTEPPVPTPTQTPVVVPTTPPVTFDPGLLQRGIIGFTIEYRGASMGSLRLFTLPDGRQAGNVAITAIDRNTPHYPRPAYYGIPITGGDKYEFRIKMRTDEASRYLAVSITATSWQYIEVGSAWTEYVLIFTPANSSPTGYLQIANLGDKTGSVQFTEPSLKNLSAPAPRPPMEIAANGEIAPRLEIARVVAPMTENRRGENTRGVKTTADEDQDGILTADELAYGLDPNKADTDGDSMNDLQELVFWEANWNADFDNDGLSNLIDADNDNDGIFDMEEAAKGTNPLDRTSRSQTENIWVEAESGVLGESMVVGSDSTASGGLYIAVPGDVTELPADVQTKGLVSYTVQVPSNGFYVVWFKVQEKTSEGLENGWTWSTLQTQDDFAPRRVFLAAGQQTIVVHQQIESLKVDQLLLSNDSTFTPKGSGSAVLP